jgi:hypothetical protein
MSHFTVLVVGDAPDAQLLPFHEFECTGRDVYIQDVDRTAELLVYMAEGHDLKSALCEYGFDNCVVSDEKRTRLKDGTLKEKYLFGYAIVKRGKLIRAIGRTNPNARWDWYQLGGRWNGYWKLKPNGIGLLGDPGITTKPITGSNRADQALKIHIDVEGMRNDAAQEAAIDFDRFHSIVAGREVPLWDEFRERYPGDLPRARQEYNNDPVIRDLHSQDDYRYVFADLKDYLVNRSTFIQRARDAAIVTHAFVMNGKWHEQGEVGHFGTIFNKIPAAEWNRRFSTMFDDLADDTLLSVYDCHI